MRRSASMRWALAVGFTLGVLCVSAFSDPVKTRRTLWTAEELAGARTGRADAGKYANADDETLWNLLPTTREPRLHFANERKGCPVHGRFRRYYAWKLDPLNHPGQVQCPTGGEWYPDADHPDNGHGWTAPDGEVYHFKAFYNLWVYERDIIRDALPNLSRAYARTGDRRYARKVALLLTRIAQQMPNSATKKDRVFKGAYGHWSGLISDSVWDSRNAAVLAESYELVFDAIDDDTALARFVSGKIPSLDSGSKIREYIEDELLRALAQAFIDEALDGNPGFPQRSGALLAAVLDDYGDKHPNSTDIFEWLYYGWPQYRFMFSNFLRRDGGGHESPSYSRILLDLMPAVATVERYRRLAPDRLPESRFPDMSAHPKLRRMFDFLIDTWDQGGLLPGIGDSGGTLTGRPIQPVRRVHWRDEQLHAFHQAYAFYGDTRYARVVVQDDGTIVGRHPFMPVDEAGLRAAAATAELGYHRRTMLHDGYGIAWLRGGPEAQPRTVWLYYGEMRVHSHVDPLSLGLFAWRRDLLPELGYPRTMKFPWRAWESDVWAHNTVIVDEGWPFPAGGYGITHTPRGVVERMHDARDAQTGLGVQVVQVAIPLNQVSHKPGAPEISRYRRTVALVDVSPTQFYALDVFEVVGGGEHHLKYSFPEGAVDYDGPALEPKPGTLAGEAVAFASLEGKRFAAKSIDPRSCLEKVRCGAVSGPWRLTWTAGDDPAVHLRITQVPDSPTEAILAEGRHPFNPDLYKVAFSFARRTGSAPLKSAFVTVVEPFNGEPCVRRVQRETVGNALVVRVDTVAGRDVFIVNGEGGVLLEQDGIETDGAFVVVRRSGDGVSGLLSGGTRLKAGDEAVRIAAAQVRAPIHAVDREARTVTVELENAAALKGRYVRIGGGERWNTYRVVAVARARGSRRVLTLDTTSLLAEGQVAGVKDGMVLNNVQMPLGGLMAGHVVSRELSGAWLEGGGARYRVNNVDYGNYYTKRSGWDVRLQPRSGQPVPAGELERHFPSGAVFAIYDYGPGDWVTVASEGRIE